MKQYSIQFFTILAILLSLFFACGWFYCFKRKVFAWLDLFWGVSFLIPLIGYQVVQYQNHSIIHLRLIDFFYLAWSTRLSLHLFKRINKHGEDKRYLDIIKKWKVWYGVKFFLLFQVEGFLTLLLCLPLFASYSNPHVTAYSFMSMAVFIGAIFFESISDWQLKKFKDLNP